MKTFEYDCNMEIEIMYMFHFRVFKNCIIFIISNIYRFKTRFKKAKLRVYGFGSSSSVAMAFHLLINVITMKIEGENIFNDIVMARLIHS